MPTPPICLAASVQGATSTELAADSAVIDRCGDLVPPGSPVELCARHLELADDFVSGGAAPTGVEDVLDYPCVLCHSRLGVRYPSGTLCAMCEWRVGETPDADVAPPRVDVVYYIRFEDRIKIGTSGNPRLRLGALWHEELLAFERGDRHVERRRHAQFADFRLGRSEWFEAHPELEAHIDVLRAGIDDPWRLHTRWFSEAVAARG